MRKTHYLLLAWTLLGTGLTGWHYWQLASKPEVKLLAERTVDEVRVELERRMLKDASQPKLEARIQQALQPQPADWAVIDMLTEYMEEQQMVLPASLNEELKARDRQERSLLADARNCLRCLKDGEDASCQTLAAQTCDIGVELTPIGDARVLIRAAANDEEIDQVDVGLAVTGLAATAAVLVTGGQSATVKAATGLARTARKTRRLTPGLLAFFRSNSDKLIDLRRLPDGWQRKPSRLLEVIDSAKLTRLQAASGDLASILHSSGPLTTLRILPKVDNVDELRAIGRASQAVDRKMPVALEMLGKTRLIRSTLKWSRSAWELAASLLAALLWPCWLLGKLSLKRLGRPLLRLAPAT